MIAAGEDPKFIARRLVIFASEDVGLADPLVTNRFLLWTLASATATASIWIVNVPAFLGVGIEAGQTANITTLCMLATASLGTATVGIYWLTFFPPAWYRARITQAESSVDRAGHVPRSRSPGDRSG